MNKEDTNIKIKLSKRTEIKSQEEKKMKMKKAMAVLLAAGMLVSSAACGGGDSPAGGNEGNGGGSSQANQEAGGDASGGDEGADSAGGIDMNEEPYTVAIQVVTLPGTTLEQEAEVEEAVNAITLPAINCKVDIQNVWISEVANTTSMGAAGGEKMDLIHVATLQQIGSMAGQGILYDMNQDNLLQTRGKKLVELYGDLLEVGNVNGQQLAVPADIWTARAFGFYYNKNMAEELNITVPEETDMDGLEKALYAVKEKKPDMNPYYTGSGENLLLGYYTSYEAYGGSNAPYGAVMDSSADTTVVNLYATDLFKDYCLKMYNWKKDGIMSGDTTDTTTNQDYFKTNAIFAVPCEVSPAAKAVNDAQYPEISLGWTITGKQQKTFSTASAYMWGIASGSERPDKAMDFLNFLYENAEVANLMRYGIEGVNYTKIEGSDRLVETNGTYPVNFYHAGNAREMYMAMPATETIFEESDAFENEAKVSPLLGYMFDSSAYQTETATITAAIGKYLPQLQSGASESEEAVLALIDEFNQKLEDAGINDVIKGNQEQLDAYLAGQ